MTVAMAGCDAFFGSKEDGTTDEIFEEGRIDPSLIEEVGYVPLQPFYTEGFNGPFVSPRDVYVGYDEFVYVIDEDGLHVLDAAGRPQDFLAVRNAVSVVQDRRLHIYVAARRDTTINDRVWDLPVVVRYSGVGSGTPRVEDEIWHPFDDDSRQFNRRDPVSTDEEVEFTGIGFLNDNRVYISRRGPVNIPGSPTLPHNAIMEFNPEGVNTQTILALDPNRPSLRSAIDPSDVMTYFGPPQRSGLARNDFFIHAQAPLDGERLRFAILAIRTIETSDGIIYRPDTDFLRSVGDTTRGDGWLYEEFKFDQPVDLAFAGDGTNYIFVLDAAKDSLFVFTGNGVEGVAPPPGANRIKPVIVSFGGNGGAALEFNNPQGVAYANEIVYVADTGNGRISRFRLNTDFE